MVIENSLRIPNEGFLVMDEVQDSMPLSRYVKETFSSASKADTERRKRFVEMAAGYIAQLHNSEIYHRDLKASNLLVTETDGEWAISLVDHDDIRFDRPIGYKERITNLAQLNASIPDGISLMDRWRFLSIYSAGSSRDEIRRMGLNIARISTEKAKVV